MISRPVDHSYALPGGPEYGSVYSYPSITRVLKIQEKMYIVLSKTVYIKNLAKTTCAALNVQVSWRFEDRKKDSLLIKQAKIAVTAGKNYVTELVGAGLEFSGIFFPDLRFCNLILLVAKFLPSICCQSHLRVPNENCHKWTTGTVDI